MGRRNNNDHRGMTTRKNEPEKIKSVKIVAVSKQ